LTPGSTPPPAGALLCRSRGLGSDGDGTGGTGENLPSCLFLPWLAGAKEN
jgi:hypothetical protein